MNRRPLVFGSDHGGFGLKAVLVEFARERGYDVIDVGVASSASVDYPGYAIEVGRRVVADVTALGVLLCGTGIGMSIAANKVRGVRAALCSEPFSASMARAHNDANVLCLGGRTVGPELAKAIVTAFVDGTFASGRHQDRLDQIAAFEQSGDEH